MGGDGTTEEQRREWALNAMGSWALDGLYPSEMAIEQVRAYISGEKTTTQIIAEIKARYGVSAEEDAGQ